MSESGMKADLASEQALVAQVMLDTRKPRCKFGDKCFRKNRKHKEEFCHPGDPEWDAPEDTKKDNNGPDLGDIAAKLLESVDQTINEVYLWRSTSETAESVLENGLRLPRKLLPFSDASCFYERAADCIAAMEGSEDGTATLILCRVLCGTAVVFRSG